MEDVLDLPRIDEAALAPKPAAAVASELVDDTAELPPISTEVALATLKKTSIAELSAVELGIAKLKEQHGAVDYDVTTPKGMRLAASHRAAVRKVRYQIPHVVKARKAQLKSIAADVEAEGERITALLLAIEQPHNAKITEEETRLEDIARKAAERKAGFMEEIGKIRALVESAKGLPSERILKGIAYVEGLTFPVEEWAEFVPDAEAALAEAATAMLALLEETLVAEKKKADDERLAREHAAQLQVMSINTQVMACMGKPSAEIALVLDLLVNTTYPEGTHESLHLAAEAAKTQLSTMLTMTKQQEDTAKQLADLKAAQAHAAPITTNTQSEKQDGSLPAAAGACASTEPEAAQGSGSGDDGKAAHAEERAAEPVFTGTVSHGPAGHMVAFDGEHNRVFIPSADDRPIETSEADAIEPVGLVVAPPVDSYLPASGHADARLLADCLAFVRHAESAFTGTKFVTQPKPGVEWWAELKGGCDVLARRLVEACGIQAGEA